MKPGLPAAALLLTCSCSGGDEAPLAPPAPPPTVHDFASELRAAIVEPVRRLEIPTYDSTGENVHPDILRFAAPWHGWRCWMLFTPYKGSNVSLENPSVVASDDCLAWQVPDGVRNPFVQPPALAYNSDPDHALDPGLGEVVSLHRVVTDRMNRIFISTTADGRVRTRPQLAFEESNHHAVSPALVISADRVGRIWYVDAGGGCNYGWSQVKLRTAHPTAGQSLRDATWSSPENVDLYQPGYVVWHLDVLQLPGSQGYLALYAAYPSTGPGVRCSNDDDFLAWSPDGRKWHTFHAPILWRGMEGLGLASLYRGSLGYDPDRNLLHVWFSGLDTELSWWSYYVGFDYAKLRRALEDAPVTGLGTELPTARRVDSRLMP